MEKPNPKKREVVPIRKTHLLKLKGCEVTIPNLLFHSTIHRQSCKQLSQWQRLKNLCLIALQKTLTRLRRMPRPGGRG
jgi:hypothetical protein